MHSDVYFQVKCHGLVFSPSVETLPCLQVLKSKVKHAQADGEFEPVWPNNEESGSLLKPSSCNSVWCANLMTETHQNSLQWYRQTFTTYSVWDLARSSDLQGLIYRSLSMPQNKIKKEKWNYNSILRYKSDLPENSELSLYLAILSFFERKKSELHDINQQWKDNSDFFPY